MEQFREKYNKFKVVIFFTQIFKNLMLKMKPIAKQIYDSLSYLDLGKHFASIHAMGKKKKGKNGCFDSIKVKL